MGRTVGSTSGSREARLVPRIVSACATTCTASTPPYWRNPCCQPHAQCQRQREGAMQLTVIPAKTPTPVQSHTAVHHTMKGRP